MPPRTRAEPLRPELPDDRKRVPPSASRMAISLRRLVPRASSMFARFKQATRRTTPAMPASSPPIVATGPASSGSVLVAKRKSGAVMKVWSFCSTGKALSRLAARPCKRGRAASAVRPGFQPADDEQFVLVRSASVSPASAGKSVCDFFVNAERQPDLRREDAHPCQ